MMHREEECEKHDSRLALCPYLQAEQDFRCAIQRRAAVHDRPIVTPICRQDGITAGRTRQVGDGDDAWCAWLEGKQPCQAFVVASSVRGCIFGNLLETQ